MFSIDVAMDNGSNERSGTQERDSRVKSEDCCKDERHGGSGICCFVVSYFWSVRKSEVGTEDRTV